MKTLMLTLLLSASVIGHAQVVRVDTTFGIRSQMQCSEISIQNINEMAALADGTTFAIGSFHHRESDEFTQIAKFDQSGVYVPGLPIYSVLLRGNPVAISQQRSGRIVVCYSQQTFKVCAGILVSNENGIVDTSSSTDSVTGGYLLAMCIDSSDRILLAGMHWDTASATKYPCTRLTPEGKIDPSFSRPAMKGRIVYCVAVDSIGRIYLGGLFESIGGIRRHGLARLQPNGLVDETFDAGLDSGWVVNKIVIQDGIGVLVLGTGPVPRNQTRNLQRFSFNGVPDVTFGPYDTTDRHPEDIALLPSGKLIVSGRTSTWASSIERLNANGSVDSSFMLNDPGQGLIKGVCPEPTGSLIAYGWGDIADRVYHQRMFRLDQNARVDHTYNVHCGLDGTIESILTLHNGSLVIGGSQASFDTLALGPTFTINAQGGIDGGYRQRSYPVELLGRRSLVESQLLANNALMVLDQSQVATDVGPEGLSFIYRLLPNGTRDAEYKVDSTLNNRIRTACFYEDGSAFIAGIFQTVDGVARPGIAKLNKAGKVDLTFDPGSGVDTAVFAIAPAGDGTIIVGGAMSRYDGKPVKQVIRLLPTGVLDTTFKTTWMLEPPFGRNTAAVKHLAIDSKNNIVISGDFQSANNIIYGNVVRLRSNGQLDRTFAMDLIVSIDVSDLSLDHEDRPVFAGGSQLRRLNGDGTTDTTFLCVVNGALHGFTFTSRDTVYAYGQFDSIGTYAKQNIARLVINNNATSVAGDQLVDMKLPLQVNLFPNPANEKITVEVSKRFDDYSLQLLDCTGQTVMRQVALTGSSNVFDVHGLSSGPYLVMVQSGGSVSCSTFIKIE